MAIQRSKGINDLGEGTAGDAPLIAEGIRGCQQPNFCRSQAGIHRAGAQGQPATEAPVRCQGPSGWGSRCPRSLLRAPRNRNAVTFMVPLISGHLSRLSVNRKSMNCDGLENRLALRSTILRPPDQRDDSEDSHKKKRIQQSILQYYAWRRRKVQLLCSSIIPHRVGTGGVHTVFFMHLVICLQGMSISVHNYKCSGLQAWKFPSSDTDLVRLRFEVDSQIVSSKTISEGVLGAQGEDFSEQQCVLFRISFSFPDVGPSFSYLQFRPKHSRVVICNGSVFEIYRSI